MELDIENMTLNEYLIYEGRHRDLARNYTPRKSVSPVRNKVLVYPDSDEEDEESCWLPPLLPCFQTPQPSTKFDSIPYNSSDEFDIDSMTLDEYDLYMAMQCSVKGDVHDITHGFTSQFFNQSPHIPNLPLDKKDSSFDETLDDLFRIGADNLRMMEHEDPNRCDEETLRDRNHKSEEIEEVQLEDVEMDENHDVDHSNTKEALQWSLANDPVLVFVELNDQSNSVQPTISSSIPNEVPTARGWIIEITLICGYVEEVNAGCNYGVAFATTT
ncbi:hypothetical protein Tco_1560841 [Tanacetum coccineum]